MLNLIKHDLGLLTIERFAIAIFKHKGFKIALNDLHFVVRECLGKNDKSKRVVESNLLRRQHRNRRLFFGHVPTSI